MCGAWRFMASRGLCSSMPRQVLFVHGAGETVHDTWDNKLVQSLERELGHGATRWAAPFIGEEGWQSEEIAPCADLAQRLPNVPVFLCHGTADNVIPFEQLALYVNAIPQAVVRRLGERDHQLNRSRWLRESSPTGPWDL